MDGVAVVADAGPGLGPGAPPAADRLHRAARRPGVGPGARGGDGRDGGLHAGGAPAGRDRRRVERHRWLSRPVSAGGPRHRAQAGVRVPDRAARVARRGHAHAAGVAGRGAGAAPARLPAGVVPARFLHRASRGRALRRGRMVGHSRVARPAVMGRRRHGRRTAGRDVLHVAHLGGPAGAGGVAGDAASLDAPVRGHCSGGRRGGRAPGALVGMVGGGEDERRRALSQPRRGGVGAAGAGRHRDRVVDARGRGRRDADDAGGHRGAGRGAVGVGDGGTARPRRTWR